MEPITFFRNLARNRGTILSIVFYRISAAKKLTFKKIFESDIFAWGADLKIWQQMSFGHWTPKNWTRCKILLIVFLRMSKAMNWHWVLSSWGGWAPGSSVWSKVSDLLIVRLVESIFSFRWQVLIHVRSFLLHQEFLFPFCWPVLLLAQVWPAYSFKEERTSANF